MAIQFRKATKKQSRLRLSIMGGSGTGKTYSSLNIAKHLGGKIAVIDTERGSASKYSDIFEFDVIELDTFHPDRYIEAIEAAEQAGYDVLVVDSITHEWNSKDGILELHEAAIRKQKTKNSFTAWADVTPLHTRFIDAIVRCKCHIITTMRSKVDYVQEDNDRGQKTVRKVGMAPIQREGMDYEHDVVIDLDIDHVGVISKTRCSALDGKTYKKPGREIAEILVAWLTDGAEPAPEKEPGLAPEIKQPAPTVETEHDKLIKETRAIFDVLGKTEAQWSDYAAKNVAGKSTTYLANSLTKLKERASKALIEEINGPISASLTDLVSPQDVLDRVVEIAKTEHNLEAMTYETLVEVRDGLNWWLSELQAEEAKNETLVGAQDALSRAEVPAAQAEAAQKETVSV